MADSQGRAPSGRLKKREELTERRRRTRTASLLGEIQMLTALGLGFVLSALFRGFCFRVSFTSFESCKALRPSTCPRLGWTKGTWRGLNVSYLGMLFFGPLYQSWQVTAFSLLGCSPSVVTPVWLSSQRVLAACARAQGHPSPV